MTDPNPRQTVDEMLEYSEAAALEILADMDDEACLSMVREFTQVMAKWQPNIACYSDDPVMLGLSCLSAAHLFKLAFERGYMYTDKKVDALNALEKAFES